MASSVTENIKLPSDVWWVHFEFFLYPLATQYHVVYYVLGVTSSFVRTYAAAVQHFNLTLFY